MKAILFLCTGNFYRSRFAEAVFNHEAERRGLEWRAFSRGLAVHLAYGELSHHTAAAMELRGIARHHTGPDRVPVGLADFESEAPVIALDRAEHYELMCEQFPGWADRIEYWDVADIPFRNPDDALPTIEKRVFKLLDELA